MCGIVGYVQNNTEAENLETFLPNALHSLGKRGPDCTNSIRTHNGSLGHTRLSIIDTTKGANQPFTDSTKRYSIVFNGEIYNYKVLRNQLSEKGYNFKTQSDTEVLLYLYIDQGKKMLNSLDGFFAFCVYDSVEQTYFLARDRFGIKPLLYSHTEDHFIFGSEMKALSEFPIDKTLDTVSIQQYFQFNYIPEPNSIFKSVKKLLPGHSIYLKNDTVDIESYYRYYTATSPTTKDNYNTAKLKVKDLVEKSVESRMIADVPIGSFLSGGIDSSIISTISSKLTKNLHTFSIGFKDEPFFDETKYALLVAKKIKSEHTVFSLSNTDLYQHFEEVLDYTDEPFADPSAINVYILSKKTKEHITVALSGDGADELFSGYNKHHAFLKSIQKNTINSVLKNCLPILERLPKSRQNKTANFIRQLERYVRGISLNNNERYLFWGSFMDPLRAQRMVKTPVDISLQTGDQLLSKDINSITDFLYNDFNLVLTNDMLKKVDSMSMANSLEVRTPFLQHDLVEYVFSLPDDYKIDLSSRKKILKDAFKEELPPELFQRGKKGFEVPLLKWFKNEMAEYLNQKVFNKELIEHQGVLNWEEVNSIQKELYSNNPNDAIWATWALVVFQHWLKKYKFQ